LETINILNDFLNNVLTNLVDTTNGIDVSKDNDERIKDFVKECNSLQEKCNKMS